jgi:predicted RNA polymerase sigma factor
MRETAGAVHLTTHERSRAVELACDCQAIADEIVRLATLLAGLQKRECEVHGLLALRAATMRSDQRELAGILDTSPVQP